MTESVSAREILRLRLIGQRIDPVGTADVADTVRQLLAVQGQDFGQALWAIGLRSHASTRSSVLAALKRGEIVRSLPMRGTLHFVASEDLRWMLSVTSERSLKSWMLRMPRLGLDQSDFDRTAAIARDALVGGRSLSRDQFMRLLSDAGIALGGLRGYNLIYYLTQRSLVCWGPPLGNQQALVLVDDWIAPAPVPGRAEALRMFARRYFAGHGPATDRDFAWWAKLTLTDARLAIDELGDELTQLSCDGTRYWMATDALGYAASVSPGSRVQALPGFDEYLLGYQDRSLPLRAEHAGRIVPGNNGVFRPTIIAGDRVVGTWRRAPKGSAPSIEPEFFAAPTSAQLAGLARSAKRLQLFDGA
ncbi:MAG TPA: winged helix DNA-binding domain-containing protein [Galbitalea sp.]|jgi:hypothetical protein|nr:winged helix DNA-binding domain-containing protein [Galbitalea sp.]